jgi:hypothetical protein
MRKGSSKERQKKLKKRALFLAIAGMILLALDIFLPASSGISNTLLLFGLCSFFLAWLYLYLAIVDSKKDDSHLLPLITNGLIILIALFALGFSLESLETVQKGFELDSETSPSIEPNLEVYVELTFNNGVLNAQNLFKDSIYATIYVRNKGQQSLPFIQFKHNMNSNFGLSSTTIENIEGGQTKEGNLLIYLTACSNSKNGDECGVPANFKAGIYDLNLSYSTSSSLLPGENIKLIGNSTICIRVIGQTSLCEGIWEEVESKKWKMLSK